MHCHHTDKLPQIILCMDLQIILCMATDSQFILFDKQRKFWSSYSVIFRTEFLLHLQPWLFLRRRCFARYQTRRPLCTLS